MLDELFRPGGRAKSFIRMLRLGEGPSTYVPACPGVQAALLEISLWDTIDQKEKASARFVGQVCARSHAAKARACLLPSRAVRSRRARCQQAVLAVGKMGMTNGNILTNVKVDVLSCHTSLRDRGANLDVGFALEKLEGISGICMPMQTRARTL